MTTIKPPASTHGATFGARALDSSAGLRALNEVLDGPDAQTLVDAVAALDTLSIDGERVRVDFTTSPIGANAAARQFLSVLRSDPTDIVGLTHYLAALGVTLAHGEDAAFSHFQQLTHRLPPVSYPREPSDAHLPFLVRIQELDAVTKQLAVSLQREAGPDALREAKRTAVFNAHALLEIWRRAPSLEGGEAVSGPALQALKNNAELQSRIQLAMQDFVEGTKKEMGLPVEAPTPILLDGELAYENTMRDSSIVGAEARQRALQKKWNGFVEKKGGKASDIVAMSRAFLEQIPHGERFEFVMAAGAELRVTLTDAGHSPLASVDLNERSTENMRDKLVDRAARTAGGGRAIRDAAGNTVVFFDCKSGHFRSPLQRLRLLEPVFVDAGLPQKNLVFSAGDPFDTGEILAIDVWQYKKAHDGQLPKDIGDGFFDRSVALMQEAKASAAQAADALFGARAVSGGA